MQQVELQRVLASTPIIGIVSILSYSIAFIFLASSFGYGVMGLSVIPLLILSARTNMKVGVLLGFLLLLANTILVISTGGDWTVIIRGGAPGSAVLILAGGLVGRMKELTSRLEASKNELEKHQATAAHSRRSLQVNEKEKALVLEGVTRSIGYHLRKPLAEISSAAAGIDKSTDENRLARETIQKNLHVADRIIWNFWDFASEQKPSLKEVELRKMVDEFLSSSELPSRIKLLNVVEEGLILNVDAAMFERAIYNLISNAAQAYGNDREIEIIISGESDGNFIVIKVSDRGRGIPSEDRDEVFRPFYSTHTRAVGLGLTAAKRVVENHQGSIEIESRRPVGTVVSLRIPRPNVVMLFGSQA